MVLYILKSSAILAILLLFYKVFLERENMHRFKRFYLLGTLMAVFIIPFVTFVEYIEVPAVTPLAEPSTAHLLNGQNNAQIEMATDFLPIILWCFYGIGVIVFGFKFFKNLSLIIQRIRRNPKLRINRITNVLLRDRIIPHTFLNYIFLNQQKFEAKEIPSEVLLHEETHAKQKHSFDILLVEVVQLLFWFNPFIYILKKAIKLNHEFLADKAVLKEGVESTRYQQLLLEYSSSSHQPILAHSINYSSTRLTVFGKTFRFGPTAVGQVKKRFTVMKTKTSKKSIVLRSILIVPLSALLLFGFSEKKLVELQAPVEMTIPVKEQESAVRTIAIRITKKGEILVQNKLLTSLDDLKSQLQKINTNLTKEQRQNIVRVVIMPDAEPPMKLLKDIEPILMDYGVAQIDIVGPGEFANSTQEIKVQGGATKKQIEEYNALAKKYNAQPIESRIVPLKDLRKLEDIYRSMSPRQKIAANPFPECSPEVTQKPELVFRISENRILLNGKLIEVNDLTQEVNAITKDWEETDYTSIEPEVYIQMISKGFWKKIDAMFKKTHYSKANGGIGLVPPPPPPPEAPKTVKGKISATSPQPPSAPKINKGAVNDVTPVSPQAPKIAKTVMSTIPPNAPVVTKGELSDIPPPPPPKSPLEHVVEMAKKDALFYYEGKEISSDKAIAILKKNKELNLQTRHKGLKRPIVEISTKPFIIKK